MSLFFGILLSFTVYAEDSSPDNTQAEKVDNPPVTWLVSTWGVQRPWTEQLHVLADYLSEQTNGKFQLKLIYNIISAPQDNLKNVSSNAVQMASISISLNRSELKAFTIFQLPFLPIKDMKDFYDVFNKTVKLPLFKNELDKHNIYIWDNAPTSPFLLLGKDNPPTGLQQLWGLKTSAPLQYKSSVRDLKMQYVKTTISEIYNDYNSGRIDLILYPFSYNVSTLRLDQLSSWYIDNLKFGYSGGFVAMNKNAYDDLPDHYKKLLNDAKKIAIKKALASNKKVNDDNKTKWGDKIKEIKFSDDDIQTAREKAGQPIWRLWIEAHQKYFDSDRLFNDFYNILTDRAS